MLRATNHIQYHFNVPLRPESWRGAPGSQGNELHPPDSGSAQADLRVPDSRVWRGEKEMRQRRNWRALTLRLGEYSNVFCLKRPLIAAP